MAPVAVGKIVIVFMTVKYLTSALQMYSVSQILSQNRAVGIGDLVRLAKH